MPDKRKSGNQTNARQAAGLKYERAPHFTSIYANNAYFESSAWDLKIVFGQLEQPSGKPAIISQQLAVTIPWTQAKLLLYYLRANVEGNELVNGKIQIRKELLPPEPPSLTPEQEKEPLAKEMHELFLKLRAEFLETC
jgi:hypothetical protein